MTAIVARRLRKHPPRQAETFPVIVAVDDQPDVLAVVTRLLSRAGFASLPCRSLSEVREAFRGKARPVAVLTDIELGSETGTAVAEWVRSHGNVPVFFMSGYANVKSLTGERVVQKPLTIESIRSIALELAMARPEEETRGVVPRG